MQLTPRYLVSNRTNIITNEAGFVVEYRPVYQRQLQVYKGIDNVLEFRVLNADQKPIDIETYTPKFMAFDENNNLVVEHDGVVLQDGDSSAVTKKGVFSVTIRENDLLNIKQQFLKYNIYLVDNNSNKVITYTDSHFGNDAVIFVSAQTFPGASEAYSVSNFSQISFDEDIWLSESVSAQPAINGNEALHTVAVYSDGFAGDIEIQTTLDNQVSDGTDWATVKTMTLDGTETTPVADNFNGVFSYIRFRTTVNPSSITKILLRN